MPLLKRLAEEKKLANMSFYPFQPVEFAPHNYAMANVNINALPRGIVYTCLPSKTAICLNSARPMVSSLEKDSWLAGTLAGIDKSAVVDVDDAEGFAQAILDFYRKGVKGNSDNSRDVFRRLFSVENARSYVNVLETIARNGKGGR